MILFLLSLIDGLFLCTGQVFLKMGMTELGHPNLSWDFVLRFLMSWRMLLCGISFTCGGLLWVYIVKHFPLSQAYPMSSMTYIFGMLAAAIIFHEHITMSQMAGLVLIMMGCILIAR